MQISSSQACCCSRALTRKEMAYFRSEVGCFRGAVGVLPSDCLAALLADSEKQSSAFQGMGDAVDEKSAGWIIYFIVFLSFFDVNLFFLVVVIICGSYPECNTPTLGGSFHSTTVINRHQPSSLHITPLNCIYPGDEHQFSLDSIITLLCY